MNKFIMRNKIVASLLLFSFILCSWTISATAEEIDTFQGMTGLQPMTEEELRIKEENLILTEKVYINDIALDRINHELRSENQPEVMLQTAELGEEYVKDENVIANLASDQEISDRGIMVEKVDNTIDDRTSKYFPKAGAQGAQGSCGAFSSTYYQMTYMNALAKDYDVKNDDRYILSPKFTFNIGRAEESSSNGIWPSTAYAIAKKHGCPFNYAFEYAPYPQLSKDYLEWPTTGDVWENALDNKVKESGWGYIGSQTDKTPVKNSNDENLDLIKTFLADGYVLNIATWISSWENVNVPNLGSLCIAVNGENGFHAMTVVGYDDTIYYDINNNGIEEPGEFGAFKIINSWGSNRYESWFAYDALNEVSSVTGISRHRGWHSNEFTWVMMYPSYTPKLIAEFKVKTNNRSNIHLRLGVGNIADNTPSKMDTFSILNGNGFEYSVDGTKNSNEAIIVLDYTDLINNNNIDLNDSSQRWFLSSDALTTTQINGFKVKDVPFNLTYKTNNILNTSNHNIYIEAALPVKISSDKVWSLEFNYPLIADSVNNQTVCVKDLDKNIFSTTVTLNTPQRITVSGNELYQSNKYYSLIIDDIRTLGGNALSSIFTKNFLIK